MDRNLNTRNYDQEAQDTFERKYAYDFDQVLRRYVFKTFQPFLPKGSRAIELGCYLGDNTAIIHPHYDDYTVVDASPKLVDSVRARFGDRISYITSTFEEINVSHKFNAAFLLHTLEHLDDPSGILRKLGTLLLPGGRLFVAVPNANAPSRQIAVQMGLITHNTAITEGELQQGHRRTYTLDALVQDARAAGLNIVQRGGVFFKPLANFQFDKLLGTDIISEQFLDGCYRLGFHYPDLCASIYVICEADQT